MADGLRTTVVGSWWPIPDFEADLACYHRGELDAATREDLLRRAATEAIAQQRTLGLTEWTGGELFTYEFIEHLHRVLTGIEIVVSSKTEIFDYDDLALAHISGELTAPNGLGYVDGFRREKDLLGGVPKATVVGPVEVAINVINELDGLKGQMDNLIGIVRAELRGLADVGCGHVQVDVPAFHTLITNDAMTVDEAVDIIIRCLEGVNAPRKGIHICSGNLCGRPLAANLTTRPWVEILQRLDGVINSANLALQYCNRWLAREAFAAVRPSIEIAAGIVDEASADVEPVSTLRERAADWARVVGEERLWLSP
jgi:methionine synthase II (cobalamin-independent)